MSRTNLSAVVSRQLPEHIREDYPTFVAFVEAYYEYLQAQGVDFSTIRDIDKTLESFIAQFRKELSHNLPVVTHCDERFLLQNIKDQYLAKGSESSYKLLFRLLFGKEVELVYPGRSMLRASDGRWNQEISVFAKVDYGDPEDVVGKLVDIQTSTRVLRVLIDRRQDIIGEVDRIVLIDPAAQVYEFFLDKRFFGNVSPGDRIRFRDEFQATIIPATQKILIAQAGKDFRVGQVFQLRSGAGTGALLKVTGVHSDGGIKYAEIIKFGIGYTADFAVSLLASNSVTSVSFSAPTSSSTLVQQNKYTSSGIGTLSASSSSTSVTGSGTNFGQTGGPAVGDELWTTDTIPKVIGVIKTITSATALTLVGPPSEHGNPISGTYTGSFVFKNIRSVGSVLTYDHDDNVLTPEVNEYSFQSNISDRTLGFDEQGYINSGDYVDYNYLDGTYVGTLLTEFSLNFRNAQVNSGDPAIIEVDLGALVKYPGYFETNNGFLDDSIYIQDSRYYQAFSYVLKIDERLETYSSAVKTMLHPAGMALFGEFNITNNYDLSIALESLVKSLGIGLEDLQAVIDSGLNITFSKTLSSSISTPNDSNIRRSVSKSLATSYSGIADNDVITFGKALSTSYSGMQDNITDRVISKSLATTQSILDTPEKTTSKYVEPDTLPPQTESGYVGLNSYAGQDIFAAEYSVGSRASTFTTP